MTPFAEAIAEFLDHCRLERNLAHNTLLAYRRDLEAFATRSRLEHLEEVEPHHVEDRLIAMSERGTTASTQARHLVALRQFFGFWFDEGAVKADPAAAAVVPKKNHRLPRVLTVEEARALVEAPLPVTTRGKRDAALLAVAYGGGLRVSELCDLPVVALRLGERHMIVRGKGRKQRLVPLPQLAADTLSLYMEQARPELDKTGRAKEVFLSTHGEAFTRQRIWQLIKRYARRVGIDREVTAHTLRHSCATHLLLGGADIRAVQVMLGHTDIGTTQVYIHLDQRHLHKVYDATHPAAGGVPCAS